ncbi:MAG: hypothetical protein KDB73_08345 [Planctomycetes bacterium]|nr:hypothetical protein [Planctomycetota bacterium]
MTRCVAVVAGVAALLLAGCRTSLRVGTPGPLVHAARGADAGSGCTPCGTVWCCGPERGRPVGPAWTLSLEGGPVWTTRNDAAIPGDTGTRFAIDDVTGAGPFAWTRAALTARFGTRHELRFLYAPLDIEESGRLAKDVTFRGRTFTAGSDVKARFRFDSWRATYRYLLACGPDWSLKVGGTLKIRDAEIALEDAGGRERKTDLGLVPLLHVAYERRLAPRWRFLADLDGLAAPQGRAFDLSARLLYDVDRRWSLGVGYRTLEGGADNDEVYTFSWLHQVFVALEARF